MAKGSQILLITALTQPCQKQKHVLFLAISSVKKKKKKLTRIFFTFFSTHLVLKEKYLSSTLYLQMLVTVIIFK